MTTMPSEVYVIFIVLTILSTVTLCAGSLLFWAATIIYALAPNKWYRDKRVRYIVVPIMLMGAGCLTVLTYFSYQAAKYVFYLRSIAL